MDDFSPQSRFKEFRESWEVTALGMISQKVMEKNTDFSITEVFTNSAEFGVMSQKDFFSHAVANDNNINGYYKVEPNDFVYNPRMSVTAPVGPVNRNTTGRTGIMSPLYYVFRTHDIDVEYLEYYFKTRLWHQFMWNNGDNGARGDRFSIKSEIFQQMPIPYPSSPKEQHLIASFFSRLDALIAAEDKKLEKLQSFKKASLEKMFPRKGEAIPQVRFNGFVGEWVKKELNEVAGYYRVSNETRHHQNLLSLSYGKIVRKSIKSKKGLLPASFDTYQVIKENIIVLRFTDLQNDHKSLRVGLSKEEGIISPAYVCLEYKDNINPDYLYLLLHYYDLCKVFYGMGDGMRQTLSYADIKELQLLIPEDKKEQKTIVDFFSRLDLLVSSQEKKLRKLRSLRKALLERMFVSAQ